LQRQQALHRFWFGVEGNAQHGVHRKAQVYAVPI
jgi:hypothetical protein